MTRKFDENGTEFVEFPRWDGKKMRWYITPTGVVPTMQELANKLNEQNDPR